MIKLLKAVTVIVFMLNITNAKSMKNWEMEYQYNLIFGMKSIEQLANDKRMKNPFVRESIIKDCVRNLQKAIVASDNIKRPLEIDSIDIYILIGTLYVQEKELDLALKYFSKAYKRLPKSVNNDFAKKVRLLNLLSTVYIEKNEYKTALTYTKEAEKILHKFSFVEEDQLLSENNELFAKIYDSLGDFSKAIDYSLASVELKEDYFKPDSMQLALSYHNLGLMYSSKQEYKKAIEYMKKSLYINNLKDKDSMSVAKIYNNMSQIYGHMHDMKNAIKYLEKALKIKKIFLDTNDLGMATIYNSFGNLYEYQKEYKKAIHYYEKALQIVKNSRDVNILNFNIGSSYKSMNNYPKAYIYAQEAFRSFLLNRDKDFHILNSKQKDLYLKSNRERVPLLLETARLYSKHNASKVEREEVSQDTLSNWLNYKGSIFDSENAIATLHANTKDKALKEKIDNLISNKKRLAKLYQSLPKPKERESWKKNIKDTEAKISTLTTKISEKAESFKKQQGLKSISYKDISKNLKENELYIDYAKAGEYYYVFSLDSKERITFTQIDENSTKKIDNLVKTFRQDVATILDDGSITDEKQKELTTISKEKLSQLYELVLSKPLSKELKIKTNLILSPDGALRLLPFEAMFDKQNGKYLIEQKEIRYIPSGKELVRLYKYGQSKTTTKEEITNTVIFSNPDFNAKDISKIATVNEEEIAITPNTSRAGIIKSLFKMRFNPLPGTKAEAASIKDSLKAENLIEYKENQANETNLMQVNDPKILHIATHGFFINDNTIPNPMLKSGIALSGANTSAIRGKSDGIVTALKLSGMKLKGTDLVVLSACQTGVVDINSTDSVSGLSKAFIQAGAKDIVMSLWSVDDQATKDLMSSFYQEMQNHPSYAKALKVAKLKMIEKGLHPFYWAAFVVSGS